MILVRTERLGQTAVLHFANRSQHRIDCNYMSRAIDNSRRSEPTGERYRVGAVIETLDGRVFDGHTGATAPTNHAEEEAIAAALAAGADLRGATIYTTMEPCTHRTSHPRSCTDLIIDHGMARVVFAVKEPRRFARCEGKCRLMAAGLEVSEVPAYAPDVMRINAHLL